MPRRPGPIRHARRVRSHSLVRTATVAVAALAGFAMVWAQTLAAQFGGAIDPRDLTQLVTATPDAPADVREARPLNLLLIGSDSRVGANGEIGGADVEGMRSDATVLAHVSGDRERIDLMSIPRDLRMEIPTCTLFDGTEVQGREGKFNVAFSNGGRQGDPAEAAACTINAVHDLTGIRIDHWAVLDFHGFTSMVDALGGIPMCIPEDIVSAKADLNLEAGPQVLSGEQSLGWARLRTSEVGDVSGSDLQRINRQQELLTQTLRAARAKNLFTDAGELTSFLRAGAESLTTDEELGDLDFMIRLAYSLRGLSADDLTVTTVPWEYTEDRLGVLLADDAPQVFEDIRQDRPLSVVDEDDTTSAWGQDDGDDTEDAPSTPRASTPDTGSDSIDDILATCGP
ncbi:LCP family protein [Demequina sp. SO4-18]|uniref:LCP family protein n=1 Tax=Demequina sp. SO4-18 TaxID=3401026 RepID=UPI003B5B97F5